MGDIMAHCIAGCNLEIELDFQGSSERPASKPEFPSITEFLS